MTQFLMIHFGYYIVPYICHVSYIDCTTAYSEPAYYMLCCNYIAGVCCSFIESTQHMVLAPCLFDFHTLAFHCVTVSFLVEVVSDILIAIVTISLSF